MSFVNDREFGRLSTGDYFIYKSEVIGGWSNELTAMKIDEKRAVLLNAGSIVEVDPLKSYKVVRLRINLHDLRQGDVVGSVSSEARFDRRLVLDVRHEDGYLKVKFARPMVSGCSFGTTCPTASTYVEVYYASSSSRSKNDEYYLYDVDTGAIIDANSWMFTGSKNRMRMALFLIAMGDKRSLPRILNQDGLEIASQAYEKYYRDYVCKREVAPEYPDRDDKAEQRYIKELMSKQSLSKDEDAYLSRFGGLVYLSNLLNSL